MREQRDMKLKIVTLRATAVLTGVLLTSFFGTARATLVEGFETTTLNSGNSIGDASIRTPNYFGINPTEGTHELLLTTINSAHDPGFSSQSGTDAASVSSVATFLGVTTSSIRDGIVAGQEGSAFKLSLGTLTAGSIVTFDYDFLTDDAAPPIGHNDFAFATLQLNSSTPAESVVADENKPSQTPTTGAGNPFVLETGYNTFTINITTTGTYTLGIGVMDGTTTDNPSALLVDNIQVNVPEPSTVAFTIAGAALLVVLRSRIKRTS
jgi:hypothetical protein